MTAKNNKYSIEYFGVMMKLSYQKMSKQTKRRIEKGKEYKNEIKKINVDININIEDFESDIENVPFCF